MTEHADRAEQIEKVRAIMKDVRTCMVTTVAADGTLHAHPMTTQEAEFDGDAWFLLGASSETAQNARERPRVNLSYAGDSGWVSLAGTAELSTDPARKKELWNRFVEAWFPEGQDDPDVQVLRVRAESAQYWDSPGRVSMVVSMLTSSVTKNPPRTGESETVDLTSTQEGARR
jgi:general stress protein 26